MKWKYYIPHIWDKPYHVWEDIWMKPDDPNFQGNMGNMINLTIDALGALEDDDNEKVRKLAKYLKSTGKEYWAWPYPRGEFWEDNVSMIINVKHFTRDDVINYARIYLQLKGSQVSSFDEMTEEEAFRDVRKEDDFVENLSKGLSGFSVMFSFSQSLSIEEQNDLFMQFYTLAIESNELTFSGVKNLDGVWKGFVSSEMRNRGVTEEERSKVESWLNGEKEIIDLELGPITDGSEAP